MKLLVVQRYSSRFYFYLYKNLLFKVLLHPASLLSLATSSRSHDHYDTHIMWTHLVSKNEKKVKVEVT